MTREEKSVVVHASSAGLFAQAAQHASTMNRQAGKKKSNTSLHPALNVETEDFIVKLEEKSAMLGEKEPGTRDKGIGTRGEETLFPSPIPYFLSPPATLHFPLAQDVSTGFGQRNHIDRFAVEKGLQIGGHLHHESRSGFDRPPGTVRRNITVVSGQKRV